MAHDVFVSYSSIDRPIADAACAAMERRGIGCWIAPRDILPGLDWGGAIIDAISGCRVMVLVFSGNANRSQQIKREVERAVSKGVTIVPLRIEDVPLGKTLEYFISTAHWLDAFPGPPERHMNRLAETVTTLLARRPSTSVSIPRPATPPGPSAGSRRTPDLIPDSAPTGLPLAASDPAASRGAAGRKLLKPRTILVGAAALALLLVLGVRALQSSPPEILGVRFPPLLEAGAQGTGSVQFRDSRGDVATALFEVVHATQFQNFGFEPPVAGQTSGDFTFWVRSAIPQRITLQAVLIDKEGKRSKPFPFTFEVQPARRPASASRQRPKPKKPSFTIETPHGMRFKVN